MYTWFIGNHNLKGNNYELQIQQSYAPLHANLFILYIEILFIYCLYHISGTTEGKPCDWRDQGDTFMVI